MAERSKRLPDGIELAVKVTPRAGRDRLAGTVADASGRRLVAVKLAAPPADGAANAALLALLADALDVPKSACHLVAGASSRIKRVRVTGDPARLAARLEALLGESAA